MDRYDAFYGRDRGARQDQMVDLILNYGFLAPALIASFERQQQLMQEAALYRIPRSAGGTESPSAPRVSVRHRLGALLVRLGTTLQGAPSITPHVSNTSSPAVSSAGS